MQCTQCFIAVPTTQNEPCFLCGGKVLPTAEDLLGSSPTSIVKEYRKAQVEMANLVEKAIGKKSPAIVEAGVGTGKSLAYLIPAILSGKRTVVSTATTNLQGQLVNKDLPFLEEKLSKWVPVKYAMAKGKSHYVCGLAVESASKDKQDPVQLTTSFKKFAADAADGRHLGDKAQLIGEPEPAAWSRLSAEECIGTSCKYYANCGYIKSKELITRANVVVANHSMVGLDLSLSQPTRPNPLLGAYEVLVLDEAHKAVNYLRNAFSKSAKANIPEKAANILNKRGITFDPLTLSALQTATNNFFRALPSPSKDSSSPFEPSTLGRHYISLAHGVEMTAKSFLTPLREWMNGYEDGPQTNEDRQDFFAIRRAIRRLEGLVKAVRAVTPTLQADGTYTYERSNVKYVRQEDMRSSKELVVSPLHIAQYLKAALYTATPTVIVTSATLAIDGRFDDVKKDFGIDPLPELTLQVKSPFNYDKNACLYISRNVPESPEDIRDPTQMKTYATAVAQEVQALADIVQGGTFALFTSRKELEAVYEVIRDRGRPDLLRQDPLVATEVTVRRYLSLARNGGKPLLLGLKSFWEGVSIEGSDLSCVIIVKLPFHPQGDPIHNALVAAAGDNWFSGVVIPDMIRDVQQGAGRLIRTATDFGIVAILDPRLRTKPYGIKVLNSLPFANKSTKLDSTRAWYLKLLTPKAA